MSDKLTVLVAEDEVGWLKMLKNILEDEGFDVICVEDMQGVLDNWMKADALIVDVMLGEPQRDTLGLVAVGKLLRDGRLEPNVPVIFISSLSEYDELCEGKLRELAISGDRYVWLQKLFEEEELIRNVREELGRRQGLEN